MKAKLILKVCECGKIISKENGCLKREMCFTCITKEDQEKERLSIHKKIVENQKKKPRKKKARKVAGNRLEKLADMVD